MFSGVIWLWICRDELLENQRYGSIDDRCDIRAAQSICQLSKSIQLHSRYNLFSSGVDFEYLFSRVLVRLRNKQQFIETSRPEEGRIYHVHSVCGRQNNDSRKRLNAVEFSKQLAHDTFADLTVPAQSSDWSQGINFVEENNAWRRLSRTSENFSYTSLRLANPL